MYPIVKREQFGPITYLWEVEAPHVANACLPGHFLMVRMDETGERIPLTVADYDRERGTVTVLIQAVGRTTFRMMDLKEGDAVPDFIGPLGVASRLERRAKAVLVGGGLGVAPIYPQLRRHKELGTYTISIIGFRNKDLIFWTDRFRAQSDEFLVATDDGSFGTKGFVTTILAQVLETHDDIEEVIAIGPVPMMKACAEITRPYGIRTTVSLNSIMVDGTGMCGSCRATVGKEMKFACVDGPDFDGHRVNFDELMLRQRRFQREEQEAMDRYRVERERVRAPDPGGGTPGPVPSQPCPRPAPPVPLPAPSPHSDTPKKTKRVQDLAPTKTEMPVQAADKRVGNFQEVALGYTMEMALAEAERCIICKKPHCVAGCPVEIDIPTFIDAITEKDFERSYRILKDANPLPAVCGRVCPQEVQCEANCVINKKIAPVAIGRLERFVADLAAGRGWDEPPGISQTGHRAAIVGAGPAGLACAGELVKAGVAVTVYEALHVAGGVLKYGIPEFRLPNDIIDIEVDALARLGVKFELDTIIGKLFTIPQLLTDMGYDTVFVGTGAGSPKFMGIPGEALNGVVSANEFLTRVNLMKGFQRPRYDTPVGMGKRVAIIGAGNTAMDACRVALRMGAQSVKLVYRRTSKESPARAEELHHAMEEGVECHWLTNPTRILGDENGWVTGMEVIRMALGEPDESGRRRPEPQPGTESILDVDMVAYALGTEANPIIARNTPGLVTNQRGYIDIDPDTGMTSVEGVFAGGDIVTGSATVILAMGAGRRAARKMLEYMGLAS
uniref:Glutamate synthase (NADPH), homotetrameric n=1 Tax=Candidatus Kentrum sp. FM TaxID=2126340 RepID=A0A450WNT0_9GAMM|nr:MAG: glutamate synthase (NADPH), homotetrameric [Candidatus Kentron sp. FM]VFJ51910.1 MAG: glutamate synthase (NADPH), homotetrameric [Candidatus Kentron sp. FM]VFK18644.1 MAG: glutamate synthase (NADPH), homotetrameric [Candidatus Kentron sp. FM]